MQGLLFAQMEPAPGDELEFHRWYDEEHIPARMYLAGFDGAVRYITTGRGPWHAVCYHLSDMAVLDTDAYRLLKTDPSQRTAHMLGGLLRFTRYLADLEADSGPVEGAHARLLVDAYAVAPDEAEEFLAWQEERAAALVGLPGWLRVRRYVVRSGGDGPPWTHLVLHELDDPRALSDPARIRIEDGASRRALSLRNWARTAAAWLYRPVAASWP